METQPQPTPAAAPAPASPVDAAGAILLAVHPPRSGFDPYWAVVGEKPALAWSVAASVAIAPIAAIALVVAPERLDDARALAQGESWGRVVPLAAEGPQMRDALVAGLSALPASCRWIVLHDAARPLLTSQLISAGLAVAERTGIACASEPATETIKRARAGLVMETLDRAQLRLVQTPQIFARERLQVLLRNARGGEDWADAVAQAVALGLPVGTFPGGHENMRLTTPDDIALVEDALARRTAGQGGAHA